MDKVEDEKVKRLKNLKNAETTLPINPLTKKVKQLENELKKPITSTAPIDVNNVDSAITSLMDRFRALLVSNKRARDDGEAAIMFQKNSILQLNRRSELLNYQLAEADKLGNEAQRTLSNAKRAEAQVALEREGLEIDKKVWLSRLPSLQHKVDVKTNELNSLTSDVSGYKGDIKEAQRLIKGAELRLLLVKTDTKAHIKLRDDIEAYKQQVYEAKTELTKLDESKAIKSGELQTAVVLKERAEGEISRVAKKSQETYQELDSVRGSVSEAEDMLENVRKASIDILSQSEKIIRVATQKRTEIEKEAKGIIPALQSQIMKTKLLSSIYEEKIREARKQEELAKKAEDNYKKAVVGQIKSEKEHTKAKRKFESLTPRLNELLSQAKGKVSEFIGKIKLLEPMLSSISKAQAQLTKELTETKAVKKAHDTERKVFKQWRKDLDIRTKRVEDREQSLKSAEDEFKMKGII